MSIWDDGIKNAVITSAWIDTEDMGLLTAWLRLDYGGVGQGFGGYALYLPKSYAHSTKQLNFAGHFIYRCMEIAEVGKWDKIVGKTIRVMIQNGHITGIGHIIKDDWFYPEKDFALDETIHRKIEANKLPNEITTSQQEGNNG